MQAFFGTIKSADVKVDVFLPQFYYFSLQLLRIVEDISKDSAARQIFDKVPPISKLIYIV
jgi:hypothetical protein